jgi:AcrR family transcriptional regulator
VRAKRTRAALLAAAEREFSEHGYETTTSRSVAIRAEVATGTFYQYFSDKDALLREIAAERLAWVGARAVEVFDAGPVERPQREGELRERLAAVVAMVMAYHRADPGLHAVLSQRRLVDRELDALTTSAEHALVERLASVIARHGVADPVAAAFLSFVLVEGAVHAHVLGAPLMSDERLVEALVDAIDRILFTPASQPTPP